MIETAIDDEGRVVVYLSSKKANVPSMALEPRFMYVVDRSLGGSKGCAGKILYATFSTHLEESYLSSCLDLKDYLVSYSGDATTIMYKPYMTIVYNKAGAGSLRTSATYLFCPISDPLLAVGEAVNSATMVDNRAYMPMLFSRSDASLSLLRDAIMADTAMFVRPVFDACGNGSPMFLHSAALLTRDVSIEIGDPKKHIESRLKIWVEKNGLAAKDLIPKKVPYQVKQRQQFFFIDHMLGETPKSAYPFGIAPPEPPEDSVGREFDYSRRKWRILHVMPPVNSTTGWEYLLSSQEDSKPVYASFGQAAFERIVQKAELVDYVPWFNPPRTYGSPLVDINLIALGKRARAELLKRKMARLEDGQKSVFYEYRHGMVYIVRYERQEDQMVFIRSMPLDEWHDKLREKQARIQKERFNQDALASLAGLAGDTSKAAIDALANLMG